MAPSGSPPNIPPDWSQWNSDGITTFAVTTPSSPITALSGSNTLSVSSGTSQEGDDVSRAWLDQTMPADVEVSAAVYVNSLIPAQVIARGSNLDMPDDNSPNPTPSFYAAQLSLDDPGPLLSIVKDVNGTETTLASINAPTYVQDTWLVETLDVEGPTIRAQLFDPSTGDYLAVGSGGAVWQTSQAWALDVVDNSITGSGFVGLGRPSSDTGTVYFDNFSVQTPSTDQTFDATTVGADTLPDNWTAYKSNTNDAVGVADPTTPAPPSGPNVLAVAAAESGDTGRAWLNTSLPASLSVSAYTYLDTLTPAEVFAEGSDLSSDMPNYDAVQVTRGWLTASIVSVVNGQPTVLGNTVDSTEYIGNVWVQETLGVQVNSNGTTTLEAEIYRTDTDQYLESNGDWQLTPTWAITATESSTAAGGQVGVGRPEAGGYAETDYFDDFTTATGMDSQNFDNTTAGSLPTGWTQWSQDNKNNYFAVATNPNASSFLSAYNVLESSAVTNTTAAVWDQNESLSNAQVTTGMSLSYPWPVVQLIARGTELGTSTPSYYGLAVTAGETGPIVTLERVNGGGAPQILAQLNSIAGYVDNPLWIQETLYVDGTSIRAQVYRSDTGQYLNSQGYWQASPAYALNYTDTSAQAITTAGYGGLLRSNSSDTVYLDNFAVVPLSADSAPPTVSISVPSGTLSNTVTVTATATDAVGISTVVFSVEDITAGTTTLLTQWEETAAPYSWSFDTSFVPNGTHTLVVQAYDDAGNMGEATPTTITTSNNTSLSMPSGFPTHSNSSVGIAELSYATTPNTDADQTLVQNDVDTVIGADQADLTNIHNWDSSVQQLVYTNVSNFTAADAAAGDELMNWLNYAEQNGIDPEQAFYHVAVATPFSYYDGGHSVQPVDWLSSVLAYQNASWQDYTTASNGSEKTGVPFGSLTYGSIVGDTMNVGYTDEFDQINVALSTDGSGGSYVLEYPTAVDSDGNPTAWTTLTAEGNNLVDGTNGLTQNGTISFVPPSNWVPAAVDGSGNNSPRFYYVRFRTTTAFSTIPVASTILGQNYTDSTDNGTTTSGVIPAYDWALNPSGGYLDASQYATAVAAGDTARFGYQSRVFYGGQQRFFTNPSSPSFREWALQYFPGLLTGTQYATGLFVDNSMDIPPALDHSDTKTTFNVPVNDTNFNLVESTATYSQDYASLLNDIARAIAPDNGWVMANTGVSAPVVGGSGGQTYSDAVIPKVQANYEEFGLSAVTSDTTLFNQTYTRVDYQDTHDSPTYMVMDTLSGDGGTPQQIQQAEEYPQTQLTTLAAYYILAPSSPNEGAVDFFGGEGTSTPWVQSSSPPVYNHWSPAAAYNIGTPDSALPSTPLVYNKGSGGTGTESDDGSTYTVYERDFTGQNDEPVMVLYKPVSVLPSGGPSKLTGSASATTVTLPGSYYVLQPNGTLSSTAVTSITLENGEGAILVDPPTSPPASSAVAMVATPVSTSPTAAMSSAQSSSGFSASQGSSAPTTTEMLDAEYFEGLIGGLFSTNTAGTNQAPMAWPLDPLVPWAVVDQFFSSWVAAKMIKAQGDISQAAELFGRTEDLVAALFSVSPVDDSLNPSSAN